MKRMKNCGVRVWGAGLMLSVGTVGICGPTERAMAQGAVMELANSDDGSGSQMSFVSTGPDLFSLRQPDFVRTDIEVMRDKLRLDTMQEQMVRAMVEEYLASFKKLIDEKFPKGMHGMLMVDSGDEGNFGDDDQPRFGGLDLDDFGGEDSEGTGMMVMIGTNSTVTVDGEEGGAGGGDGGGDPNVGVQIQVAGPEGKDLTPEQQKALEEQAKKIAEEMKAKIEKQLAEQKANGGGAPAPQTPEDMQAEIDEMAKKSEVFAKEKAKLRGQFVQDAQARISPGQVDLWPGLERALLRKKSLSDGRLDGERTDLFKVVEKVQVPAENKAAVDQKLSAYELQLNDALVQRNQAVEDADKKINEAMRKHDMDKAVSIADRASNSREALRDVNMHFAEELTTAMGPESGKAFATAAQMAFHPRIYGKTRAQRAFEKAAALDGLTDEQQKEIASMSQAYEIEVKPINEEIRQTTLSHEGEEIRRPFEHLKKAMEGNEKAMNFDEVGGDVGPVKKAYAKRTALDERSMKALYGMFTPEQVAILPKLPSKRPGNTPMVIYQAGEISGDPVAGPAEKKKDN